MMMRLAWPRVQQAQLGRSGNRLGTVGRTELGDRVAEVMLDRSRCQPELAPEFTAAGVAPSARAGRRPWGVGRIARGGSLRVFLHRARCGPRPAPEVALAV